MAGGLVPCRCTMDCQADKRCAPAKSIGEVAALCLRHDAPGVHPGWCITEAVVFNSDSSQVVKLDVSHANDEVSVDGSLRRVSIDRAGGVGEACLAQESLPWFYGRSLRYCWGTARPGGCHGSVCSKGLRWVLKFRL